MLPASARLRSSRDFTAVVRGGRRCGRQTLVVHLRSDESTVPPPVASQRTSTMRAGFVVSRAVGGAVVRNRVKRRLRELVRSRSSLLVGCDVVVRALPAAAAADFAALGRDLDSALLRLGRPGDSVRA